MSPWKTSNLLNDEIKDEGFDSAPTKRLQIPRLIKLTAPLIQNTYISSIQIVWLCLQYCPYTIGVFEFDKAEASWLICSLVLHDDTIYDLPILWEVVSQCLWENKRQGWFVRIQGN